MTTYTFELTPELEANFEAASKLTPPDLLRALMAQVKATFETQVIMWKHFNTPFEFKASDLTTDEGVLIGSEVAFLVTRIEVIGGDTWFKSDTDCINFTKFIETTDYLMTTYVAEV